MFFDGVPPRDFAFIGLIEHYAESMSQFLCRFPVAGNPGIRKNYNPDRHSDHYDLSVDA